MSSLSDAKLMKMTSLDFVLNVESIIEEEGVKRFVIGIPKKFLQ